MSFIVSYLRKDGPFGLVTVPPDDDVSAPSHYDVLVIGPTAPISRT